MTGALAFEVLSRDPGSAARVGRLRTARAIVETPVFMPVGTQATVKSQTTAEVEASGARLILANTYHLMLRPGDELMLDVEVVEARVSQSRPSTGIVTFKCSVSNKSGETLCEMVSPIIVERRDGSGRAS